MAVEVAFVAINPKPKEPIADPSALLEQILGSAGFSGRVNRELATYPPAQPWKSRVPKKGPRKGGRRTGTLGRNWRIYVEQRRDTWQFGTRNRTAYAIHVEGPVPGEEKRRQTQTMRDRGWPNITRVGRQAWVLYNYRVRRVLMQRDPNLRYRTARP